MNRLTTIVVVTEIFISYCFDVTKSAQYHIEKWELKYKRYDTKYCNWNSYST